MSCGVSMEDWKRERKKGKSVADIMKENGQVPYEDRPENEKDVWQLERMRNLEKKLKY